tara:strand:- start:4719 stop:6422 length:1704 start_codon:yes stop_codon:yes gene_type:complete
MSSIQTLLESANPWKSLQSDAGKLASKWSKTGLLEGFNSEVDKNNMSILLENQAKQLVVESSATGQGGTFTVGQSENWAGIALPLVRKVFGGIAAKEFVSVQPMNLPSGLVFFLDFQYGTTANPFASGGSLYGTRNATGQFPFATPSPVGGLYGAGRFAYTTNQFSSSILITGSANGGTLPVVASGTATVVTASWADCNFDAAYSASAVGNRIYKITITASALTNFDPDGVRAFVGTSASAFTAANQLQELTTYNYTANTIALFYTSSATLAAQAITSALTVNYNKSTADNTRGDFEDTTGTPSVPNAQSATTIAIPEINIKMQSQAITAKTKKLKAVWTPEFAQDLNAYQNIDAEAELTNIMSEYISMEIDLEILDMLIEDAAAATEYWDVNNNSVINGTGTAFVASTSGFYNTQGGWFQTLGTKMQKVSNKIHQLTLRGGANFLVCSPTVATVLESIPGFAANTNGDAANMEYAMGVQKVGAINSRYTVYKNPYMTENVILMGFRGKQFLESGAVFAPYIPLIMTPLIYDPATFTPRKGLMTRYAKKMLRPEFYGKIYVSGLNTL